MEKCKPTREGFLEKIRTLEERLWEAEQTIQAIRGGEVDAFIVHEPTGEQVYTLKGADHGYRILVESISEGALILSSDNSIYYCNRTLGEILQLSTQKIISRKLDSYVASDDRAQMMELIKQSRSFGEAKGEFQMKRDDGTLLPVNISLNRMSAGDFEGVCAVVTDLSVQKQVEERLQRHRTELELLVNERTSDLARANNELRTHQIELEMQNEELRRAHNALEISRSRYADLYDFAPVGYLTLNKNGQIIDLNLTAARQLGIERRHSINRLFSYSVFQPDKNEFLSHLNDVFEKQERQICELRLSPKGAAEFYARLESIYLEGEDGAGLCRTNVSDITLRKRAEHVLQNSHNELEGRVQERTAELSQAVAKLEAMNQELQEFAFVASHDLQEPLRKIQTFGNILVGKHKESLNPVGQDHIERIIKSANRMSELLRSLLDYSRAGTSILNYKRVSLTEVAKDAASDLEFSIARANGSVEINELPTVDADAALLRQLFQNIIANSIKYRKESESLVVKIYGRIADATCQVFIEDNGIGFDECYGAKIFKPFERLHGKNSPYTGTGMGLAICRKIVARHGGEITVNSILGRGTTFIVSLPTEQKAGA